MQDTQYVIVKKEIDNPTGESISKYQQVTIRVQEQGSKSIMHSGVIGKNDFNAKFEALLVQMKKGERWILQDQRKILNTVQVLQLGKIEDSRTYFEIADGFKTQGNSYIKTKEYGKAVKSYTQAYNLLVNDPSAKAQELKLSIVSNLALATLNSSQLKASLQWCEMHLQESVQPNVKIVYRKASANKGLKQWQQAKRDVGFGIQSSKGDEQSITNFNKLLVQIEKEQKEQKIKEKAVYGKMFN